LFTAEVVTRSSEAITFRVAAFPGFYCGLFHGFLPISSDL
jgi:hypothetical protein